MPSTPHLASPAQYDRAAAYGEGDLLGVIRIGQALDPTHTFVHWEVVHMGTSTIRGRFSKVTGNVQFDDGTSTRLLRNIVVVR